MKLRRRISPELLISILFQTNAMSKSLCKSLNVYIRTVLRVTQDLQHVLNVQYNEGQHKNTK